jgi:hypothetical protein
MTYGKRFKTEAITQFAHRPRTDNGIVELIPSAPQERTSNEGMTCTCNAGGYPTYRLGMAAWKAARLV